MISDLRKNGEERDDELQYEYSSSISDAESCSSDSEDDAISDQNQQSDSRKLDASGSGPLYDLSSLMAQLPNPNKRGLSKYYDGKSQSFTSLSDAKCKEDLPKKESPYNYKRKIKPSKSYADGLSDKNKNQDAFYNHNPNNKDITRNSSRGSCGNLLTRNSGRNMLCRPPTIPLNKNSSRLA